MTESAFIEDIFGQLGFRVKYKHYDHYCNVSVYEIVACDVDGGNPNFVIKGGDSVSDGLVDDIENAKEYLTAYIKWDGCSDFQFQETHWCGPFYFQKYFALLEHIYKRSQELIGEHGNYEPWGEGVEEWRNYLEGI